MSADFHNCFTGWLVRKFAINFALNIPSHLTNVATLIIVGLDYIMGMAMIKKYMWERTSYVVACWQSAGVMVQDGGCGQVVNTRISGGRVGVGFSTQGSARLSSCTIAGVHFGVSIVVNKPAEVVMEDNSISAKMLVNVCYSCFPLYSSSYVVTRHVQA